MGTIVVGVDPSETSRRAAEKAAKLASELGAQLHLVMCAEKGQTTNISVGSDSFHVDGLTEADQFLKGFALKFPDQKVTSSVGADDPASAICKEAERLGADLIVVGNRRVQGLSRVLGSVAGDVMKKAHCDVYVANTKVTEE